jgi:hypothetical protein
MNKKLTLQELHTILDSHAALKKAIDSAVEVGCLDPNGPLYHAAWKSFEDVVSILDPNGWIMWHIYDNEGGVRGLKVKIHDVEFPVETRRDLLYAINVI